MTGIEAIAALFAGPGARDYLGEPVTIGEHMRQAGALAEAKRYLCATEPGYSGLLSPESVRTLALQGGPMGLRRGSVQDPERRSGSVGRATDRPISESTVAVKVLVIEPTSNTLEASIPAP